MYANPTVRRHCLSLGRRDVAMITPDATIGHIIDGCVTSMTIVDRWRRRDGLSRRYDCEVSAVHSTWTTVWFVAIPDDSRHRDCDEVTVQSQRGVVRRRSLTVVTVADA